MAWLIVITAVAICTLMLIVEFRNIGFDSIGLVGISLAVLFGLYYYYQHIIDKSIELYQSLETRRLYNQYYVDDYRNIEMQDIPKEWQSARLNQFYILGAHRCYQLAGPASPHLYSIDAVQYAINAGARILHLDLCNRLGNDIITDISIGVGISTEYALDFTDVLDVIKTSAWKHNKNYPLILYLSIPPETYNKVFIDTLNYLLTNTFGGRLLISTEGLNQLSYADAVGKVVVLVNQLDRTYWTAGNTIQQGSIQRQLLPTGTSGVVYEGFTTQQYIQDSLYEYNTADKVELAGPFSTVAGIYHKGVESYGIYQQYSGYRYIGCGEKECGNWIMNRFSVMLPPRIDGMTNGVLRTDLANILVPIPIAFRINGIMMNFQLYDTNMAAALRFFRKYSFIAIQTGVA